MAPVPVAVESDLKLPAKVDVVVIGGGIIGAATTYFLAERGVSVALVEKQHVACEQSSRNWGWCRQMGRDPREMPLIVKSLELWRGLNERLGAETGFRQRGIFYLATSDKELARHESWLAHARPHGVDSRLIGTEEVAALLPGAARAFAGALHTPSDGRAEPTLAAPALARAARAKGAILLQPCAARGLERQGGRVAAVVTERGTIRCATAVLAGGAWSRLFCGNLGLELPQLKVVNSVLRTGPLDAGFDCAASGAGFAFRKRLDGGFTVAHQSLSIADIVPDSFRLSRAFVPAYRLDPTAIRLRLGRALIEEARLPRRFALDRPSPFERLRGLDPAPSAAVLKQAAASLAGAIPAFADMRVVERWAGAIDVTPDAVPVISPVPELPGLVVATGFSGHGFGIGPGAGWLAADLATGAEPLVDPAPFRWTRFSDGSKPRPFDLM